ncbi:cobalt/nickel transport protein [Carboxydocella sporoproducens DSM 16521]|uniref:Cobalt/nickel transport protein n=3 Tax=Clostridiales Family XVI. Incertae Sedis TaxID=543347 RepID=A0A1T4RB24_9FIRM|nr:cobalt/nickel transport protein [Carboxydocella thermautotrophica]SKA13173.1 cobalt/nickel transport protein [Carboxydocella sporoproducens DSM 16521]
MGSMKGKILSGLGLALAIAAFLSPFASSSPDGLERVAEDHGFLEKGTSLFSSPIPDYLFPGIQNEKIATAVAGIVGTCLVFIFMYAVGKLLIGGKERRS